MTTTISIIVAAHREGLIAHKTMLSLKRATEELEQHNISYEVIVTIDNGDTETHRYFDSLDHPNTTCHKVDFKDLAASRNYGVSLSSGKYVATLDADDLVSKNWLIDSIKYLDSLKHEVVLHTQYSINFGTQDIIWEKFDSRTKDEDALIMTWANRWDSAVVARRSIFIKFPYQPNTEGYGSEDWHFNSQTLAADIPHKVTPETILFVRRKDVSMMTIQAADRRTVRYTNLLDFDFMKTIDTDKYNQPVRNTSSQNQPLKAKLKNIAKNNLRYAHNKAKSNKLYVQSTQKIRESIKARYTQTESDQTRFPKWLITEWRSIHFIEKETFPEVDLVKTVPLYHSEMYELGIILANIVKQLTKKPTYIVFLPHLAQGGAELVALRYIKTLSSQHPDWHIAVVSTELGQNTWLNRLPDGVDFVSFGEATQNLSPQLKFQLLARFIVQSQATHLHIAQSPTMFHFTSLYKSLLEPYAIYAFAFCEDKDNQGRIAGHVHSGLPFAYSSIDKVFTDCDAITTSLTKEYGYDSKKFHTHYQPVETSIQKPREAKGSTLKVLWASRIAKQKRPDILIAIGNSLAGSNITIDVYGSFQDGYSDEIFSEINNISYIREFNGIDDVPTEEYDAYLYTSENDGMPNAILEAAAKGLVIIAPSIGGIPEFVGSATGKLITDNEDVDSYVHALHELLDSPKVRLDLAKNAQDLLLSQHSSSAFEKVLLRDIT